MIIFNMLYISPAISNWDSKKKIISVGKQGKGCQFVGGFQGKCNPLWYPQEWRERINKQEIKKMGLEAGCYPKHALGPKARLCCFCTVFFGKHRPELVNVLENFSSSTAASQFQVFPQRNALCSHKREAGKADSGKTI